MARGRICGAPLGGQGCLGRGSRQWLRGLKVRDAPAGWHGRMGRASTAGVPLASWPPCRALLLYSRNGIRPSAGTAARDRRRYGGHEMLQKSGMGGRQGDAVGTTRSTSLRSAAHAVAGDRTPVHWSETGRLDGRDAAAYALP